MKKMEATLVKTGQEYILYSSEKEVLAISNGTKVGEKLSLKNCQEIEDGYDLDELAKERIRNNTVNGVLVDPLLHYAFKLGAEAILELLSDKKFSEEDLDKVFHLGWSAEKEDCKVNYLAYKRSLQQTSWQVEVIMDICGDKVYAVPEPVTDENGCILLKRKV